MGAAAETYGGMQLRGIEGSEGGGGGLVDGEEGKDGE